MAFLQFAHLVVAFAAQTTHSDIRDSVVAFCEGTKEGVSAASSGRVARVVLKAKGSPPSFVVSRLSRGRIGLIRWRIEPRCPAVAPKQGVLDSRRGLPFRERLGRRRRSSWTRERGLEMGRRCLREGKAQLSLESTATSSWERPGRERRVVAPGRPARRFAREGFTRTSRQEAKSSSSFPSRPSSTRNVA